MSAKLDQRAAFMPGNGAGMRLEQAEHFFARRYLLAFKNPPARLGDDALHQRQHRHAPD